MSFSPFVIVVDLPARPPRRRHTDSSLCQGLSSSGFCSPAIVLEQRSVTPVYRGGVWRAMVKKSERNAVGPGVPAEVPTWELHTGDCLAGMASLSDASVDVVITDPPYEAEAHTAHRMVARAGGRLECEPIAFPPITEEERMESARQMARLARRWILVFCQVEGAMKWRAAF